jgi:hypothetical protein
MAAIRVKQVQAEEARVAHDRLRGQILSRTKELAQRALTPEFPSAEDMRQLEALKQLESTIEVDEGWWSRNKVMLAAIAGAALIVFLMIWFHVDRTVVELDLRTREVVVTPRLDTSLMESLDVAQVEVAGGDVRLTLPPQSNNFFGRRVQVAQPVTITSADATPLTVNDVAVSAMTSIRLGSVGSDVTLEFTPSAGTSTVVRVAGSRIKVSGLPNSPGQTTVGVDGGKGPNSLSIASGAPFTLTLRPARGDRFTLLPNMALAALGLTATVGQTGSKTTASVIESGAMYFEGLNDRRREIRPGELLRLDAGPDAYAPAIEFSHRLTTEVNGPDNLYSVRFHGTVTALKTGEQEKSLLPTWLEWLQAQQSAVLFWGAVAYVTGLAFAFRRWVTEP